MKAVKSQFYIKQLQNVLRYIFLDNPHAAVAFERELQKKISLIQQQPQMCRVSKYHQNSQYRDLIHKGYTIIYKIEKEVFILLDIFKWQAR